MQFMKSNLHSLIDESKSNNAIRITIEVELMIYELFVMKFN